MMGRENPLTAMPKSQSVICGLSQRVPYGLALRTVTEASESTSMEIPVPRSCLARFETIGP
jgi:hypothetical protein